MIKIAPVDRIHRDLYDKLLPRYKEIYSAEAGGFREGKYSKLAEKAICDITGRKYALLTTSGTSSIMIGCIALGLKPHDEVIVINMSAAGTVQPIKVMGAIPVYSDIDKAGQQDFSNIKELITDKTKFIIATGLYGDTYDHDAIKDLGLPILNDAAQSLTAKYKGIESAKLGDISCLSFGQNKTASMFGTYGAVLTDDDKLYEEMRYIRRCGENFERGGPEIGVAGVSRLGVNAQPHEDKSVQVLCALEHMPLWQEKRKKVHQYYYDNLKDCGIEFRPRPSYSETNYHKFAIFVDNSLEFADKLKQDGIESQPHYTQSFAKIPVLANNQDREGFPGTHHYNCHSISIPATPWMTDSEIDHVVSSIKKHILSDQWRQMP